MTGQEQIQNLYNQFKALHPNNKEPFVASLQNMLRWDYAVKLATLRSEKKNVAFAFPDNRDALTFAKTRSVSAFSQFPKATQDKYLQIAALFPGRKVYATGSRVTGEYADEGSGEKVEKMRADLLKKNTKVSDFDFTIDFEPGDLLEKFKMKIPAGFDLIVNVPEGEPKILIHMWDFEKIPKDRHNEIIDLVNRRQWSRLMDIHNEFELSPQTLCCNSKSAEKWFTWAVKEGVIKQQNSEQE
jgi:hypothetical protein